MFIHGALNFQRNILTKRNNGGNGEQQHNDIGIIIPIPRPKADKRFSEKQQPA